MQLKTPERVERIYADIAKHFQENVAPNGFGAQVVTYDRESCLLYKQALDRLLPGEMSDVVMTVNSGEDEHAAYRRDRDAEERLLDRFRDPNDPLKILIVTSKLLTGFDAPILQAMYLDKPLRDHTLLQAICRSRRNTSKWSSLLREAVRPGRHQRTVGAAEFSRLAARRWELISGQPPRAAGTPESRRRTVARF